MKLNLEELANRLIVAVHNLQTGKFKTGQVETEGTCKKDSVRVFFAFILISNINVISVASTLQQ